MIWRGAALIASAVNSYRVATGIRTRRNSDPRAYALLCPKPISKGVRAKGPLRKIKHNRDQHRAQEFSLAVWHGGGMREEYYFIVARTVVSGFDLGQK